MDSSQVVVVQNGNMKGELSDCGNAQRYDAIFQEETVKKFLVLISIVKLVLKAINFARWQWLF